MHNEQECIGQRCWHDLVIKDATVKQGALNVTDMDKVNIGSSQAILEMSSISVDTRSMSSSPLVNSFVKINCSFFKTARDIDEPTFQFVHTMDSSVVDTTLHDNPDLVIHRIEIWAVFGGHMLGARKSGVS